MTHLKICLCNKALTHLANSSTEFQNICAAIKQKRSMSIPVHFRSVSCKTKINRLHSTQDVNTRSVDKYFILTDAKVVSGKPDFAKTFCKTSLSIRLEACGSEHSV